MRVVRGHALPLPLSEAAGFVDLVLVKRPRVIFAELKRDGEHPSPAQQDWLDDLTACGQETFCWHPSDWPEIEEIAQETGIGASVVKTQLGRMFARGCGPLHPRRRTGCVDDSVQRG